jgi:predicted TIM-barrel fold metal-dependent hydrolase
MLYGSLVIDAVAHSHNLSEENFAYRRHAEPIREMIYGVLSSTPAGYQLARDAVLRDWQNDDTATLLFNESETDFAVYHPTPIFAFKDGLSAVQKGADIVKRWPSRFKAYAAVDPLQGQAALDDLARQVELLNPIGLKLYPTSWRGETVEGWRMDDPKIAFPLFEAAAEHGIRTIAVHKALPLGPSPIAHQRIDDMEGAVEHFPELNFEIVHGGMAFVEETAWLLARFPNVYVNWEALTIILVNNPRAFAKILLGLMQVGGTAMLERQFWGIGVMQYHPRLCLDAWVDFEFPEDLISQYGYFEDFRQITDEDKRKILGENYARMHGFDLEALRRGIEGDEFAGGPPSSEVVPYSTTSIADQVIPAGVPVGHAAAIPS